MPAIKFKNHMFFADPKTNSVTLNVCTECGCVVAPSKEEDHRTFHAQSDAAIKILATLSEGLT